MDRNKVLIVANHEIVIYNFRKELVEMLLSKGYEVALMCPGGPKIELLIEQGCMHYNYHLDRRGKNLLNEIKLYMEYKKVIRDYEPDIVLTYTIKPNIYAGFAAYRENIEFIANVTGLGEGFKKNNLFSRILKNLYKYVLNKSKVAFFQNEENFVKLGGTYKTVNWMVLPGSGVNLKEYYPLEYPKNDIVILTYIGRMMRSKGVLELLEAFDSLKHKNVKLQLVGYIDDDIETEMNKLISKNSERIKHFQYTNNVKSFIKDSDAIILPSHHEGMSNALLEAAASARPLLASDIPGCREIVIDGYNGFLFEAKNPKSIAKTIDKFIKLGIDKRKEMGVQGRIHVEKNFDREIINDAYFKALEKERDDVNGL